MSFSLRLRCVVVDVEMHDVVQVPDPCIRPIMSKLGFPVDLTFCSTPQCVSSFVVMLLPRVRTAFTTSCDNLRCAVVW